MKALNIFAIEWFAQNCLARQVWSDAFNGIGFPNAAGWPAGFELNLTNQSLENFFNPKIIKTNQTTNQQSSHM